VQHLARDVTEVAEIQEEVARARATIVMEGAHTTQVERMARERADPTGDCPW
jgi:hypothetical protein